MLHESQQHVGDLLYPAKREWLSTFVGGMAVFVGHQSHSTRSPWTSFLAVSAKKAQFCVFQDSAVIAIIAETTLKRDPKLKKMKKYESGGAQVMLRLGKPEVDMAKSRQRLVEDLDCMSDADFLITSGGGFSALGAAVQKDGGVSLNLRFDNYRVDVPGAAHMLRLAEESSKPVVYFDSNVTIAKSEIPNAYDVHMTE